MVIWLNGSILFRFELQRSKKSTKKVANTHDFLLIVVPALSTIQERIKRHRDHPSLAKLNPLARLTLSDRQQHTREHKKVCGGAVRTLFIAHKLNSSCWCILICSVYTCILEQIVLQ